MEMGRPGGRGQLFPAPEPEVADAVGADLIPGRAWRGRTARSCPRSPSSRRSGTTCTCRQMTLGMMGVSLFGTCTMKYNSKTSEFATLRPELAEVHPYQHPDTLQGVLEIMHDFDGILRDAVGHGPVHLPGGRRGRCGLYA